MNLYTVIVHLVPVMVIWSELMSNCEANRRGLRHRHKNRSQRVRDSHESRGDVRWNRGNRGNKRKQRRANPKSYQKPKTTQAPPFLSSRQPATYPPIHRQEDEVKEVTSESTLVGSLGTDAEKKLNSFADNFSSWTRQYTNFHLSDFDPDRRRKRKKKRRKGKDEVEDDEGGRRYSSEDNHSTQLTCPKPPDNVNCQYNYSRDECPRAGGRSRKCSSGGLCCFDGCRNACFNPEGQSLSSEIGSGSRKKFRRRHRRKRKNGKDSQVEEVDVYGAPEDDEPATGYFVSINENDKDQCPKIRRKRQYQCHGKDQSTCWSPGVPDLDCPYSGLCCFDGCANKCLKSQSYEEEEEQPSYEPEQPTYNQEEDQPSYNQPSSPASYGQSQPSYEPSSSYEPPESSYEAPVNSYQPPPPKPPTSYEAPKTTKKPSHDGYGAPQADLQSYQPQTTKAPTYPLPSQYKPPTTAPAYRPPVENNFQYEAPPAQTYQKPENDKKKSKRPLIVLHIYHPDGKDAVVAYEHGSQSGRASESNTFHQGLEETGNLLTLKTQQENNDLRRRRKVSHHELQIVSSGRVRCPNNVEKKPWALCNFVRSDFKECSTPNQYDPTCGGDLCCFDGCTYSCLRVEGQDYDEKRSTIYDALAGLSQSKTLDSQSSVLERVRADKNNKLALQSSHEECPTIARRRSSVCHSLVFTSRRNECFNPQSIDNIECAGGLCCYDGCNYRCLSDIERGESKKISTTIYRALDNANRIDAREDKGHREKCPPLSGYDCQKKRPSESDCNIDSDCQGHKEMCCSDECGNRKCVQTTSVGDHQEKSFAKAIHDSLYDFFLPER